MWHLKTKLGVFWIIRTSDGLKRYRLGINEDPLSTYNDPEQAARDVHDQATGFLPWDIQSRIFAPEHIQEWHQGEPEDWKE